MFGYIVPNKAELKIKEYDVYRSYYCGVCGALRRFSGYRGAAFLRYDMAFLALILNGVYETGERRALSRCVCRAAKKHPEVTDAYSDYTAKMCVILSYYKCLDDFHDDKSCLKLFAALAIRGKAKRVMKEYRKKSENMKAALDEVKKYERSSLDEAAGAFGRVLGEVFAPNDDIFKNDLYSLGFYLGKFIYILDAYEDIAEDIKRKRPNPLIPIYGKENFESECENYLNMMGAECAAAFERLPIVKNEEILRNIIYGGIWQRYEKIRFERTKGGEAL